MASVTIPVRYWLDYEAELAYFLVAGRLSVISFDDLRKREG